MDYVTAKIEIQVIVIKDELHEHVPSLDIKDVIG